MRHSYLSILTLTLVFTAFSGLRAQEQFPLDSFCIPFGDGLIANVITDDFPSGGGFFTNFTERECFFVDQQGNLFFSENAREERCCGTTVTFTLEIFRPGPDGADPIFIGVQPVELTVKCPKPECGIVDLTEFPQPRPPMGDEPGQPVKDCIAACENSTAIYLFPEDPNLIYEWTAVNGDTLTDPSQPGQVSVTWGSLAGGGALSLAVYAADGTTLLNTFSWCLELTPSPVADFTASSVACLGQEVYFTNTSSGAAATYDWDFGDGNTAQNVTNPSHAYATAGTYTVTLFATSDGTNPDGSQACCCTDTVSYDIVIDPLPGPQIYWVSTLCEGDTSIYWTDATGCDMYNWSVSGNGTIIDGLGNDTITVVWTNGPSGTVELGVVDCDDMYCTIPSVAVVPIISTNGVISGPIEVCKGESANYELPKWQTVTYNWATSAGAVNGPNDGHVVNITWPTVPGTYVIEVDYGSEFLAGLPNHDGDDCYGTARLEVTVLGDFTLTAQPNPACVYQPVEIIGTSDIVVGEIFTWSVAGYPGLTGTGNNFFINPGDVPGPGAYTVTAVVNDPASYCVTEHSITVFIKEAIQPTITGPADYCVGDPVVYTIPSPAPGYTYTWQITPFGAGTIDLGQGSPTATVTFNTASGVTLSVTGTEAGPNGCVSDPVSVSPVTKELVATSLYGPAPCTNSLADYGITQQQHPDATYTWTIDPAEAGSVVAGLNDSVATIQWNDTVVPVSISLEIELCGQILEPDLNLTLTAPLEPVIVQDGDLCPSGSVFLRVDDSTSFASFAWTTPQGGGPSTAGFTVTAPGDYVVNTVDNNGCPGVARFRVETVDGPDVSISLSGLNTICVNNPDYPPFPANPTLTAITDAANTIEWFCNNVSQGAAATGNNTFVHVWNDTVKTYAYTVVVTDPNGCTESPDPIFVHQRLCCGDPYVTEPFPDLYDFTATRQDPNCDVVYLEANFSGDSVLCSGFDLPLYSSVISFGGNDDQDTMRFRLPGVGCFTIGHEIGNYAFDFDTVTVTDPVTGQPMDSIFRADTIKCATGLTRTICNPLFAEFDYTEVCGVVVFSDESQIDPTLVTGSVNYAWDFGDGNTGSGFPIDHGYTMNGTYTVTLTLSDDDCQSQFTLSVVVDDLPDSDFTFAPATVCEGEPITFTGTGSNVIEWEWDFDDGATFNGNGPQRTFMTVGGVATDFDVVLYTTNSAGCLDTVTKTITVYPAPAADEIEASNGLIICAGTSTTLSVDNVAGYTYLWTTGQTGNAITVDTAGTYGVTITTADNCSLEVDPVEVQVIPLPSNAWKGNPFICDNGSTTLMALAGGGHDYEWFNVTTGSVGSLGASYTVPFLAGPPEQEILLTVTSQDYGCVSDTTIFVKQVSSPNPILAVDGGLCEGDGSTIYVTNPEADVVYSWNTQEVNDSIFTYQAGTYIVIATNTISGCTGTAQVTINPLPDVCSVPTGCYETCAPDTLCAPAGNFSYAWFQNGVLVGSGQKLEVTESASYTVTVFDNVTGCFASSDSLYLEVLDCEETDCDRISTDLKDYVDADGKEGCCAQLFYGNLPEGIYAIEITSPDADLDIVPGSVNPLFGYAENAMDFTIQLAVDGSLSAPLPNNAPAASALAFCPSNFTVSPQTIIVNYLDADREVVCSDTLRIDCEPEPECLYVTKDVLECTDSNTLVLTFEACVPVDSEYDIGFLQLLASSAAAMTDLPEDITVSPAMVPGECRTFSVPLSNLTPGEEFCYSIVAHTADPATNPDALCCTDGAPRCLEIPDCDPCDDLSITLVDQSDDCCFQVTGVEDEANFDFDRIDFCLVNSSATLSVQNVLGNSLFGTVSGDGQTISYTATAGGMIPNGVLDFPRFCLEDNNQLETLIEIKWILNGKVVCTNELPVRCEPDCGYLEQELIECDGDVYVWYGNIVNTSPHTVGEAHIKFDPALGLGDFDTTIVFTPALNPNDAAFVELIFGGPIVDVDSVCFTVTLHELNDDDFHLNCCQFEACIELPDCDLKEECLCQDLEAEIDENFSVVQVGINPLGYQFTALGNLNPDCDRIFWYVRSLNPATGWQVVGTTNPLNYVFSSSGSYQIALLVQRTDDNGRSCQEVAFQTIDIKGAATTTSGARIVAYPNPARETVNVRVPLALEPTGTFQLHLYDATGGKVRTFVRDAAAIPFGQPVQLNVRSLAPGVYTLRGTGPDGPWVTRIVVSR